MYTYSISKNLSDILGISFEEIPELSDQTLLQIPKDLDSKFHNKFAKERMVNDNPMKNPEVVARHLAAKKLSGYSQSDTAKRRNIEYWANPDNKKKLSDRWKRKKIEAQPSWKISNHNTQLYFYSYSEAAKYINQPPSTVYKYAKLNKRFNDGWLVEKVQVDSVSKSNLQNSD